MQDQNIEEEKKEEVTLEDVKEDDNSEKINEKNDRYLCSEPKNQSNIFRKNRSTRPCRFNLKYKRNRCCCKCKCQYNQVEQCGSEDQVFIDNKVVYNKDLHKYLKPNKNIYNNNNLIKPFQSNVSALQAISLKQQTVLPNLAIPFDTNQVLSGNDILHTVDSTEFYLKAPGVYKVTFTASVDRLILDLDLSLGIALALNGYIIPGSTVTQTAVTGIVSNLYTQAIVQTLTFVNNILTVVNTSNNSEIFTNPNIIIQKIS